LKEVVYILFGAVFAVAVASALGTLLLRRLRISFYRGEAALFTFVSGSAVLSLATFLLCVLHVAYKGVFLVGGIATLLWAWRARPTGKPQASLPAAPRGWNLLFLVVYSIFFIVYFFNALAPEISPDGAGYHLTNVVRLWRQHGFAWDYHTMYAFFPQGVEMLFLVAFVFGHFSAAALVHFAFLLSLPLLIVCYGRRYGFPRVGLFAAILVFVSPVAAKAGVSAYNDLAVATVLFAVFYLLQIWDEERSRELLILIGLLAGFSYGMKYTAAIAIPFAAGFICWRLPRDRKLVRALTTFGASAAVMVVPWILRNWIWVGNPFAPLLNRWFPNPYYHPGMEQGYLAGLREYEGLQHWWGIPWRHIVSGELVGGMIGPIFLLAPLALLALRTAVGRRLLTAGLLFGLPALANAQTRFLIPVLPFLSLGLGLALGNVRGLLPVLASLHAIAGIPAVSAILYAHQFNWRVDSVPVAAALRRIPEPVFLAQNIRDYPLAYLADSQTPPGAKIFTLTVGESAYASRDFIFFYESALGNLGFELVRTAMKPEEQPSVRWRMDFPPVRTRRVRIVQTASATDYWSIAELQVNSKGRELARSPAWKLTAWPNRWEAGLAFDGNDASRWSSWQPMSRGMFVGVDFGEPQTIDEVVCAMAPNQKAQMHVEVATEDGRWTAVAARVEHTTATVPSNLRRQSMSSLKSHGIGYVVFRDGEFESEDVRNQPALWGLVPLGRVGPLRLYRIQ